MKSDNPGLFSDCDMLHPLKGTLAGSSDTLNWSETTLIRNWDGIAVGGSPERVTGLELPSWSLSGSIPSGLGDLSNLTTLNLSGNGIIGSIPFGLGDLSSLVTLNLSTNQLSGAIPSELGDLSSLWTLDLSTNQLHGPIPSDLGDLSKLRTLNLSNNSLGGSIPSKLGNLSSLITLNLSGNHLSGSIPSKLGNLSNLTGLDLSGNELDWEIPEELNQLDKLREVDLNGNLGLIGPAHLDFTELSKAHLGYMETETWAVADFSYATTTWSVSGMDSGKFAITSDGVLTFRTAPDFEVPSSSVPSNDYSVDVTASVGGKTAQISVTVMDRDFALSVSPGSIVEEGPLTQFIVTATLDVGTNQATSTTVTLSLAGSAGADDYATTTPSSITIPANSASATTTLILDPTNDDIVEGDEVVKVVGASGDKYVSPAWITIDDKGDVGTLSLSGSVTDVSEGNDASFTVTLSDAIGPEVTVGWSVTPDSGDFSTPSGSVTFAAGSTANATTTLTLTATDDLLSEVLESFRVMLGAVTGDISDRVSVDLSASSTVATISESDPITVTLLGSSSVAEGESATSTVSLYPNGVTPTADLTVDYATADGTADSGDYESATGTLTFTFSDAAAKTVTVQTTADSIAEGDETFSFGLSLSKEAGGGGPTPSLRDPSSITTTIDDDDAEPTSITLSVSRTEVSEGDGMATTTLTATLEGGTTRNATTTVALSLSGTATSTGLGADYTAVVPSEMTIPAEAATGTATLIITPTNDEIVEGEETIRVEGTVSNFTVSLAEITINDDDSGTLSLSGSGTAVLEGNDASFTVTLSDAIGPEVTVGWSVTPDSGDFSTPSGSVTFAAGSTANATTTLTLTATDDLLSEVLESFRVMLGAVTGDISDRVSVDLSASSTVATISESDPITVTLSGNSSVDEGESVTYTVSLDGVTPTADLTVGYATNPAVSGDYEGVSETLTFTFSDAAAKTVTVQTTEDSIAEGEETFSFELSNVAGGGGPTPSLGDPWSITTTIVDDDRRHTQRPPTFNEGATTTRAALENSEVGTEVGEPVRATDRDGDRLEYWLRGTDRASFHLDSRTGQLTTALLLDYETQSEYSVQVRVRDGEGGSDGIDVTITIVDLDEAPSQPGAPEVRSTGPTGLAVSWTAPDNQGPEITDYDVRYREAGGEFQDAEFVGADTSITLNNLKPGTSYEVQVRAVNAEGASPWSESGRDETEHVPPSPTPTPTPTPEPTATATPTPEPTATRTPTRKPTATRTPTPEPTATPTPTPEPTATATPTPEPTATATPTPEPTATATPTPEPTATATLTPEPTATPAPTPEPTATPTPTPTATPTPTPTATATPTPEPTATATPTPEPTATPAPTPEPTATPAPTPEPTAAATPTPEPTTTPMAPPLSASAPTSTLSPPPTSAPIATATPAVTPEPRESDSEGGLPWWVILLLSLGRCRGCSSRLGTS